MASGDIQFIDWTPSGATPKEEFQRLRAALYGVDLMALQKRHAAPAKPRLGMLVHADGNNWDPGHGAGIYLYITSWVFISPGFVSQADAEAGTGTTIKAWSPLRVAQAIAALASGGGQVSDTDLGFVNVNHVGWEGTRQSNLGLITDSVERSLDFGSVA